MGGRGLVTPSYPINPAEFLGNKKGWNIAKTQIKICDAVNKEEARPKEETRQTLILTLFGPVSRCVPSAEDGWHPYTPNRSRDAVRNL